VELPISMKSLWQETAPLWDDKSLNVTIETDLVVVGAGITGLSAALRATERGLNVVVLDAERPGWGASGRNGGQVIPGRHHHPDDIVKRYGSERGEHLVDFSGRAADAVFELIERYKIDCDAHRSGWLQPAYNARALRDLSAKAEQLQSRGAAVEMLDAAQVQQITGSKSFKGGFFDPRAGGIHPLKYCLGLAQAARNLNVEIYSHARVIDLQLQGERFLLQTDSGRVIANRVLLCTNGYTDPTFGPVAKSYLPLASIQVATDPLPDALRKTIMSNHLCASDTNRLLVYFRMDSEGRFIIGGRGATYQKGLQSLFSRLEKNAIKLFPDLASASWPYRWGGLLALTRDHYPHIHQPQPGLVMALGYNGRGIAMATRTGAALSDYVIDGDASVLPVSITDIKRFPLGELRNVGLEIACFWYMLLDRLGV
jgi:glycine/D-amino acid oxidase-like deaminating enzyme